jgi:hypothetical protein
LTKCQRPILGLERRTLSRALDSGDRPNSGSGTAALRRRPIFMGHTAGASATPCPPAYECNCSHQQTRSNVRSISLGLGATFENRDNRLSLKWDTINEKHNNCVGSKVVPLGTKPLINKNWRSPLGSANNPNWRSAAILRPNIDPIGQQRWSKDCGPRRMGRYQHRKPNRQPRGGSSSAPARARFGAGYCGRPLPASRVARPWSLPARAATASMRS